jgi:hypothetical protein
LQEEKERKKKGKKKNRVTYKPFAQPQFVFRHNEHVSQHLIDHQRCSVLIHLTVHAVAR